MHTHILIYDFTNTVNFFYHEIIHNNFDIEDGGLKVSEVILFVCTPSQDH